MKYQSVGSHSPLIIFASLLLIFAVLGCSGNSKVNTGDSPRANEETSELAGGDTLNISGKLICAHCYALNNDNTGHDHLLPESGFREGCAGYCSLQGYPVGVLLDNDLAGSKVWVIRTSSQLFADYMTQTVRIKGTFVSEGVIEPLSIELKSGKNQWITVM